MEVKRKVHIHHSQRLRGLPDDRSERLGSSVAFKGSHSRRHLVKDCAQGELIRFVNLQSNRTVEAVADGPGRARVTGPAYTH